MSLKVELLEAELRELKSKIKASTDLKELHELAKQYRNLVVRIEQLYKCA